MFCFRYQMGSDVLLCKWLPESRSFIQIYKRKGNMWRQFDWKGARVAQLQATCAYLSHPSGKSSLLPNKQKTVWTGRRLNISPKPLLWHNSPSVRIKCICVRKFAKTLQPFVPFCMCQKLSSTQIKSLNDIGSRRKKLSTSRSHWTSATSAAGDGMKRELLSSLWMGGRFSFSLLRPSLSFLALSVRI